MSYPNNARGELSAPLYISVFLKQNQVIDFLKGQNTCIRLKIGPLLTRGLCQLEKRASSSSSRLWKFSTLHSYFLIRSYLSHSPWSWPIFGVHYDHFLLEILLTRTYAVHFFFFLVWNQIWFHLVWIRGRTALITQLSHTHQGAMDVTCFGEVLVPGTSVATTPHSVLSNLCCTRSGNNLFFIH